MDEKFEIRRDDPIAILIDHKCCDADHVGRRVEHTHGLRKSRGPYRRRRGAYGGLLAGDLSCGVGALGRVTGR